MNAAEHLEMHLGHMDRGWSSTSIPAVQVCLFRDQPASGVATLATLGLSNIVLSMGDRTVRQELLFAVDDETLVEHGAKLLMATAESISRRGQALRRGDVVPIDGPPPIVDLEAKALYASIPVAFPDGLATLGDTQPATVFVWLFPISSRELAFVDSSGWRRFEERLETTEPDLFDIRRASAV